MTEEEIREKLAKLEESRLFQEEKVNGIQDSLERLKQRYSKENKKLADIDSEIAKFEGRLCRKILLKNGIEDFNDFENVLAEIYGKRVKSSKGTESYEESGNEDTGEE